MIPPWSQEAMNTTLTIVKYNSNIYKTKNTFQI